MRRIRWNSTGPILAWAAAILVIGIMETEDAWAWRSPPPAYWAGPRYRSLPRDFRMVRRDRVPFYFYSGRYYRRGPSGFHLVAPPIGIVVPFLPLGYVTFVVGGVTYYDVNGVYYTRVPEGYCVVESPVIVEKRVIETVPESIHQVVVEKELLKVRSGPGSDHDVIAQIKRGTELKVIGNIPEWYYVELVNGERGWVKMKFVSPVKPESEPED